MIRIVGDGIAGTLAALSLAERGEDVVVHGDGVAARCRARTLVHRHAGRSFRTDALEDAAWPVALAFLRRMAVRGTVRETEMVRPVQERLAASVDVATDPAAIRTVEDDRFGPSFRYGPAFSIDAGETLALLQADARDIGVRFEDRVAPGDVTGPVVIAVGAALAEWVVGLDLQLQGGHLVTFAGVLDHAVSARGVHAVPSSDHELCAGSTWWDPAEPMTDEEAVADLRGRLERAGIDAGDAHDVWRGIRCVHAVDRRPLVGQVDDVWVVGALGTRGWLWAPWLAQRLSGAMCDGEALPPRLDIARTAARLITG